MTYMSTTVATARARNEYLIQLAATNHSVARYFTEEAPDIIDVGFWFLCSFIPWLLFPFCFDCY